MYQKIYVAVDSSTHARQATDLALALGHLFKASVVTGHVDEADHAAARRQRLMTTLADREAAWSSAQPTAAKTASVTGTPPRLDAAVNDLVRNAELVAHVAGVPYEARTLAGRAYESLA